MPRKGFKFTEKSRAKMSAALMGNKRFLGLKHSPEAKAMISVANRGRKYTPEALAKMSAAQMGNNKGWRGGRTITSEGYVLIFSSTHPNCDSNHYVPEHRLVMESHLGRTLLPTEVVHHINGTRNDNRIENLILFSSPREHVKHHRKEKYWSSHK